VGGQDLNRACASASRFDLLTPQMAMIGRLGLGWPVLQKHLLARRHQELAGGEQRTFSSGLLRPVIS